MPLWTNAPAIKTATNIATVRRPMNPGITENVRIGTRTAMAIAEARPGRMGWSSAGDGEIGREGDEIVDEEMLEV